MTRYTIRIKATIFVVLTTRYRKLTNRTDGDGTQSEHIVNKETRILTPIQNTLIYSHLQDSRLYFPAKSSKRS